jgi:hypothetical protein
MHKDMQMTSVSWQWENSLTQYQGSFSGPLVPSKYGLLSSACQLILTKVGSLLSQEDGNLQVSLNPGYSERRYNAPCRSSIWE